MWFRPLFHRLDSFDWTKILLYYLSPLRIAYCKYWIGLGLLRRPVAPPKLLTPLLTTVEPPHLTCVTCSLTYLRGRQSFPRKPVPTSGRTRWPRPDAVDAWSPPPSSDGPHVVSRHLPRLAALKMISSDQCGFRVPIPKLR